MKKINAFACRCAAAAAALVGSDPALAAEPIYRLAIPQRSGTNLLAYWDFNQPGALTNLACLSGAWRPAAGAGPDGSSCMETCTNITLIALDVPGEALPLEITYRHTARWTGGRGNIGSTWTWDEDEGAALVTGFQTHFLDPPPRGQAFSRWYTVRILVTARWTAVWNWDDSALPSNILLLKRPPGGRLLWINEGIERLDDLAIRHNPDCKTPDLVTQCLEALERIPPEKRVGVMPLPGVKSADGKKNAEIRFLPGSSTLLPP